jgi:hypothetical protein
VPGLETVTFAVADTRLAPLARITVDPGATPVTGTVVVVAEGANTAVAGTVATPVLSEARLTIKPPAGAGADNVSVRFLVVVPGMVRLVGEKRSVAFTCTACVAGV